MASLLIFQIKALIDKMDGRVFLYKVIEKLITVKKAHESNGYYLTLLPTHC